MNLLVTCALIVRGTQVLCTQRGPGMTLPYQWEFPGGKIEEGETAEQCILREIKEELNLDLYIVERGPSVVHPFQPDRSLELIPFVCAVVGGELLLREHADARWCEVEEMRELDWADADVGIVSWWDQNSQDYQNLQD